MINGMLLADIHFGALPLERYLKEIEVCIFDRISELSKLDFVIILGDMFDMKEYGSSDVFKTVISFCKRLIGATEEFNTEIVIIEGTRGHDALQTLTLKEIFSSVERFKVYHKVTADTLCGCIRVLYIPEEFVVDKEEYYKEFFNSRYDFIFGHGMVDKVWFSSTNKNHQAKSSVPIFTTKELTDIATKCYFGHIHKHSEYGNFKYVGSFSRWEFGQEENKGYYMVEFDEKTKEINEEFIVNHLAPIMNTKIVNVTKDISISDLDDKINSIMEKNLPNVNKLRLIVNLSTKLENYLAIKDYLSNKINNKNIKFILNIISSDEEIEDIDEVTQSNRILHNYLFDKEVPSYEKISKWIKSNRNKDITITEIEEFLSMKV